MFRVGLENNTEGRSLAWVLGHPGCFAFGADGPAALEAVPGPSDYRCWISEHSSHSWLVAMMLVHLKRPFECYTINDDFEPDQQGYEVNAWFRHDWKPLTSEDIQHGHLLLDWGREHLLNIVGSLSAEVLDRTYPAERWSIRGILNHIAGAEWWYLDRLGLSFPRANVPAEPFQRLDMVRHKLVEILPGMVGSTQVVGLDGEFWSPRKLLRRAVWHEVDHINHIRKLI
jgi:hypothetical protein